MGKKFKELVFIILAGLISGVIVSSPTNLISNGIIYFTNFLSVNVFDKFIEVIEPATKDETMRSTDQVKVPKELIKTSSISLDFKELLLKEVVVYESFPLLNYIFFDKDSSQIPSRYKLFKSATETKSFSENNLFKKKLIQYHHILNIVGSRMKARPDVNITLVGCNDNLDRESGNTELSRKRANVVQEYLTSIWGIDKNRIKVTYCNLPDKPSCQTSIDGQAENRRVEIEVKFGKLFETTETIKNELFATPEKVDFSITFFDQSFVKGWSLTMTQDGKVLKQFKIDNANVKEVSWDWGKDNDMLPQGDKPIVCSRVVYTVDGDSDVVNVEIPLSRKVLTSSAEKKERDNKIYEKIGSILYGFNKHEPLQNMEMEKVFSKITSDDIVSISGHTDIIGSDETNLSLSERGAKVVHDILKGNRPAKSYEHAGLGKKEHPYDNSLPEGRFYNRTAQVFIERNSGVEVDDEVGKITSYYQPCPLNTFVRRVVIGAVAGIIVGLVVGIGRRLFGKKFLLN